MKPRLLPHRSIALAILPLLILLAFGCEKEEPVEVVEPPAPEPAGPAPYAPLPSFEPMAIPGDNPMTEAKITLGRMLFFDARLSGDGTRSCYSCHLNEKGLADGLPTAVGAFEKKLTRNSPTLWNIGYHPHFYWDGRAVTLEAQVLAAWKGGNMGASEPEKVLEVLNGIGDYRQRFQDVFGEAPSQGNVPKALAAYMRTIISGKTAWDAWKAGDESALSDSAKRGTEVFAKAKCDNCHSGVLFTDMQFHNVGIGMAATEPDVGRFKVTEVDKDMGAFKTPTLRDVADSAPYFHDGSVATLEEAVRLMVQGGIDNEHLDRTNLQPANLTDEEIADLVEFLRALDEPAELEMPEVPGAGP